MSTGFTTGSALAAVPEPHSALRDLAAFVRNLTIDDAPARTVACAKRALRHNLMVALAGRAEVVPGQDGLAWPPGLPRAGSATRLTDGVVAPADYAVVTNSLAMGGRAQHDEQPDAVCHFGSVVLPALLAASEQAPASGADFLIAMIAGYEVGTRLGARLLQYTSARGWRPTSVFGPFAAAAAVTKVRDCDEGTILNALSLAANSACGLTQTWLTGSDEWRYQTALAARDGFADANLASAGATGAADTIEGARGFLTAFAGAPEGVPDLAEPLGERWAVDNLLLKPFPVCAFNQAPIQQLIGLMSDHRLSADDVVRIEIRMPTADLSYPGVDVETEPTTRAAALMSLRACAAIAAIHGDVDVVHLDRATSAPVRAVAQRVVLVPDDEISSHMSVVGLRAVGHRTIWSGAPAPVVYNETVGTELLRRLRVPAGMTESQVTEFCQAVEDLDAADDLDRLWAVVRQIVGR